MPQPNLQHSCIGNYVTVEDIMHFTETG